jgi:hypothetical protein
MDKIKFIGSLTFILLIYSCSTLKISESKSSISDLAVKLNYSKKVNPIYLPKIDTAFDKILNRFNNENHSFKVHKIMANDTDYLSVTFNKGRYKSKAGEGLGYFVFGINILALSSGELGGILFYYYFPNDILEMSMRLSPSLSGKGGLPKISRIESGVLFSSKTRRITRITNRTYSAIYNTLVKLDKQNASKK